MDPYLPIYKSNPCLYIKITVLSLRPSLELQGQDFWTNLLGGQTWVAFPGLKYDRVRVPLLSLFSI